MRAACPPEGLNVPSAPAPRRIRPAELVLRCYGRRSGRTPERWVAHCIDLDLWAVGRSWEEAQAGLEDSIRSYVRAVVDTDDAASVLRLLLRRKAPFRFVALWHFIRLLSSIRRDGRWPLGPRPFEELMPLQLAV